MNRTTRMAIMSTLLISLLVAGGVRPADGEQPTAAIEDVEQLIKQLGANDYFVRERASTSLKSKPKALAALRIALDSDDAEVRYRSKMILADLQHKQLTLALEKMNRAKRDGKIDLFVEYATVLRPVLGDADCKIDDLFIKVVDAADRRKSDAARTIRSAIDNWLKEAKCGRPEKLLGKANPDGVMMVTNSATFPDGIIDGYAIISEGSVEASSCFMCSIVLSNGNARLEDERSCIGHCLVICDGDVETNSIHYALVIARGKIIYNKCKNSIIIQGEQNPLGVLSFFELSDVGLEVAEETAGLHVKSVQKDGPFAKCGFQAGDCLLTANGKKIESANDFRRVVRRHLVESVMEPKPLPVQVERDGKKRSLALEIE